MVDLESYLYGAENPGYLEIRDQPKNNRLSKSSSKKVKDYTGLTSTISGLFFSGVGYAVGVTGSLVKDIAVYACSEIPKIPEYASTGIDQNTIQSFYNVLGESLTRANYYGGMGAALGLFGGALLMVRLKYSAFSIFRSVTSIFKK